eukprot:CAMPEP_0197582680 /NCGR_PEP_ID=MMETSP1326-20131121/5834_1 /TAXON_ID=1155430 /ORGANISM="Genus nov. species nov., Strain RCC2288" /LENGTH=47 /DNA_ID= /DNA_START= /DNA_END= /DNA_ORIENTATION=
MALPHDPEDLARGRRLPDPRVQNLRAPVCIASSSSSSSSSTSSSSPS